MYDRIIGPTPISEEEKPPLYAERAAKARKNTGLDIDNQARGVIRKQDKVIVIDNDNHDIEGNLVQGVFVKEDPVDCFSVSGEDTFPGQEIVNLDTIDQLPNKGETLGCGKPTVKPRMLFSPKIKGKTHGSKATTGVDFPQIHR